MLIYQESLSSMGRFLLLGVQGGLDRLEQVEFWGLYQTLGDDACFVAAEQNQIAALVAHQLVNAADEEPAPRWRSLLRGNRQRVERLVEVLGSLTCYFDEREIGWALIENGGVLFGSDMPLEAFCAGDFDIIVTQSRWDEVVKIFAAEGFEPQDRRHRPTNRVEFVRTLPDGTQQWINAGFLTFDRMWVPLPVVDLGQVWLSRRVRSRKNSNIWVLRAEDSLALVAMHTSLHSFIRAPGVRLHVDVDRLVRDNPIDWDEAIDQNRLMGVPTRAFTSLSMARGLLNSPIPEPILSALFPGRSRWAIVERLLATNSVILNDSFKLGRFQTLLLDALIDERPVWSWLSSIIWPDHQWLYNHFSDDPNDLEERRFYLHAKRYYEMVRRWKPS